MFSEVFSVRTMLENFWEHHCIVNYIKDNRAAAQILQSGRPAKRRSKGARISLSRCEFSLRSFVRRSQSYSSLHQDFVAIARRHGVELTCSMLGLPIKSRMSPCPVRVVHRRLYIPLTT